MNVCCSSDVIIDDGKCDSSDEKMTRIMSVHSVQKKIERHVIF